MFFSSNYATGFSCGTKNGFIVQGLYGMNVYNLCIDPFLLEYFASKYSLPDQVPGSEYGDIFTFVDRPRFAYFKFLVISRKYWHDRAAKTQIHGTVVISYSN